MPQIREYQSKVAVAGPVSGRAATGEDFGAGLGQGLRALGAGIMDGGEVLLRAAERDDISDALRDAYSLRSTLTIGLHEQAKFAESYLSESASESEIDVQPPLVDGAPVAGPTHVSTGTKRNSSLRYQEFAEKFTLDMDDRMLAARNELKTQAGREQFDRISIQTRSELMEKAYLTQANLAGVKAMADVRTTMDNMRKTVWAAPQTLDSVAADMKYVIQAQSHLPAEKRDELLRKGYLDLAKSAVQGDVRRNPQEALDKLLGGSYDEFIDPDAKESLITSTVKLIEHNDAKALAAQKRAEQGAAKVKEQREEVTFESLYQRLPKFGGNLTMQQVMDASFDLSPANFRTLMDEYDPTKGGDKDSAPNPVYANLRTEAGKGRDVRTPAKRAYNEGVITRGMYDKVIGEVESNSPVAQREQWHKNGRKRIEMFLGGSSLTATGLEKQTTANALSDFDDWAAKNGDATPEKAKGFLDDLLDRYQIIAYDEITITRPLPRGTNRGRGEIDDEVIKESWKTLEEARRDGEITQEEYRKEAENLRVWSDQIRKREQARERNKQQKAK